MFGAMGSATRCWRLMAASLVLFSIPGWAQSLDNDTGVAQIIALSGQVSVLRDSTPWALQLGNTIKPGQFVVTGPDGFAIFKVSDGSTFEVYQNSRVVFRENPGTWKDLLEVMLGRIKVHIQKLGGQPNNNRIHTPTAVISVRGTTFDVTVEEDDTTLVVVEEGVVDVRHLLQPGKTKQLSSGEWIRVYKNQPLASKSIDKGSVIQGSLRAASEALYTILLNGSRGATSGAGGGSVPASTGGGGGAVGDKGAGNAPPPPPPAAPPPPPPPPAN
jgi:hypothetical protein